MDETTLRTMFPRASDAFIRANSNYDPAPAAIPERAVRDEPVGEAPVQKTNAARFLVRIVTTRKRLCDEDNLVPKWWVDCLRAVRLIPDDDPATAHIEVHQEKAAKGEEESTVIEVIPQT